MATGIAPREIKLRLKQGKITTTQEKMPAPPPEWPKWKQDRLAVAILAAELFLLKNKTYDEIHLRLSKLGLLTKDSVKPQRIGQYIRVGTDFLVERGVFKRVKTH